MNYQEQKQAWQRRLVESLHGSLETPAEPAGLSEGKVDFDGGVRESAPHSPGDPQEHNDLLLDLLQQHGGGNAADFWPMGEEE